MRVADLRAQLDELPELAEVAIRVVVGGDLGTDDLDVEEVLVTGDDAGTYLVLVPPDVYDVRNLVDDGLLLRAALEDAEQLGDGYLRATRDEDGEVTLDHVDATRVLVLPPPATT